MSIDEMRPDAGQAVAELPDGSPLREADAEGWLPRTCFKTGPPGRIGIELEFVVHADERHPRHLPPDQLWDAFDDIEKQQLTSRFTLEPGGQVELSSLPADSLPEALNPLEADLRILTEVLSRHGARMVGAGVDPLPPPPRILDEPRYAAMESYLDGWGRAGRTMMRRTASVQVNVEAGRTGRGTADVARRWELLHVAGPALAAAFDTSGGLRQRTWLELDPQRCRAPVARPGESVVDAWTRWVLDAPLMAVRRPSGDWRAPSGLTFRTWQREGRRAVPDLPAPTLDDLGYHLTTLFPPVRARGHLEVRYLDAQPGRWWRVPAATVTALLDDDAAAEAALAACEPVSGARGTTAWELAATGGLDDPLIGRAARRLLDLAADALDRSGSPELARLTHEYLDRKHTDPEAGPC